VGIYFLNILERSVLKSGYIVYAWALMGNHYHFVVRTSDYHLGMFMSSINGPYAQFFIKTSALVAICSRNGINQSSPGIRITYRNSCAMYT
jgi:hypothetical protein